MDSDLQQNIELSVQHVLRDLLAVTFQPRRIAQTLPPFLALHSLLVVVDIDLSLSPLAGRDATLEHNVDFAIRAILHFR